MPEETRTGWVIAIGLYEGREFDWDDMKFREPDLGSS